MLTYTAFLLSVIPLATCFAVSCFGIGLARTNKHKVGLLLQSLGRYFFYGNYGSLVDLRSKWMVELAFSLLITSQFLRTFVTFVFAYMIMNENITVGKIAIIFTFCIVSSILWDVIPRWVAVQDSAPIQKLYALISSAALTVLFPIHYFINKIFFAMRQNIPKLGEECKNRMKDVIHELESIEEKDQSQRLLILRGILRYQDKIVREIMIPRVKVSAVHSKTSIGQAADMIVEEGYTRTPVYESSIDNVIGILMTQDIFKTIISQDKSCLELPVTSLMKQAFFVPETLPIGELLQEFRKRKTHLAVVVDEYGGTSGVVTIEDVIEEIVGNIEDEYDEEDTNIILDVDGSYIVDAKVSLSEIQDSLCISISREGDYESLNGYLFFKLGFIPKSGFIISNNDFELEVISSDEKCVQKARIRIQSKMDI